jgi:hypothetical protein
MKMLAYDIIEKQFDYGEKIQLKNFIGLIN